MPICPSCYCRRMNKYDTYRYGGQSRPRFRCTKCGMTTAFPLRRMPAVRRPASQEKA